MAFLYNIVITTDSFVILHSFFYFYVDDDIDMKIFPLALEEHFLLGCGSDKKQKAQLRTIFYLAECINDEY